MNHGEYEGHEEGRTEQFPVFLFPISLCYSCHSWLEKNGKKMNREVRERGFTLLEILVAVTILAVSFTAIFHLYGGTLRNIERSERHARAAVLGGEKLEELLAHRPFPPVNEQGVFPGNPDYSYKTTVEEYKEPVGRKEKNVSRDAAERIALYRLAVRVEWKDGETAKEFSLNTLKAVVEANR